MAKKEEKTEEIKVKKKDHKPRELRDIYLTGFRNIDTLLGFRNYDDDGNLLKDNRGVLSGSKFLFTGDSYMGKSTLADAILANMARPFVKKGLPIKIHIFDTEHGTNWTRFRSISNYKDEELDEYVVLENDISMDNLKYVIDQDILEKQAKDYKGYKTKNAFNEDIEIPYPTFILVDSFSNVVSRDALDLSTKDSNAFDLRVGLDRHKFFLKYTSYFADYNINIFFITHKTTDVDMNAMPGMTTRKWGGMKRGEKVAGGKKLEYQTDVAINLLKFDKVYDDKSMESAGLAWLETSHIIEAKFFKNRQSKPNQSLFLVLDKKGFNPVKSFIYDCMKFDIISSGAYKTIEGYEKKFRKNDIIDLFENNNEFRKALYTAYDKYYEHSLDANKRSPEEMKRIDDVLDLMMEY